MTYHVEFQATGTVWHIDVTHPDKDFVLDVFAHIRKRIEDFEQTYSRFRNDSLVHNISEKAGVYLLPVDATPMLDMYKKLYDLSSGSMTPLIGQVLHDTGYDVTYSLTPKRSIRDVPMWQDVLKYTKDSRTLIVYKPVQLDFGAIGKGYLVDIIKDICEEKGINMFTIDAGRDIYHVGETVDIALENPFDVTEAIGVAHIMQGSICGSAGNRRSWNAYNHILDPYSKTSPRYVKAVWIVAGTAMIADALTTAIFFTPLETLKQHFSFEYVIVYEDGSAVISQDFPGKLF